MDENTAPLNGAAAAAKAAMLARAKKGAKPKSAAVLAAEHAAAEQSNANKNKKKAINANQAPKTSKMDCGFSHWIETCILRANVEFCDIYLKIIGGVQYCMVDNKELTYCTKVEIFETAPC